MYVLMHAIRPFLLTEEEAKNAPQASMKTTDAKGIKDRSSI